MDWPIFFTVLGASVAVIGCIYQFLRNFKTDINSHIDRLEKRMNSFELKINSIEERMFYMATGKRLEDAILEERMKRPKTDP